MSLEEVECYLIKKTLGRYDGNVSRAADALGTQPQRSVSQAAAPGDVGAERLNDDFKSQHGGRGAVGGRNPSLECGGSTPFSPGGGSPRSD